MTLLRSPVRSPVRSPAYDPSGAVEVSGDPYFANVVLLVGFDGADGATTATDDSPSAHALTFAGNAQIDTAQSKVGGASLLLDGTGDWVTAPDSANWDLADANSDPYTIETFVRIASFVNANGILAQYTTATDNRAWRLWASAAGGLQFDTSSAGTSGSTSSVTTSAGILSTNTWYHIAVDKDAAGKIRIYVDGVMQGSATPANSAIFNSNQVLIIGAITSTGATPFTGHIDEVRITKGVARYASDAGFTPPTAVFPRS